MIDIIIDGFWCNKCQTIHPTLFWHEKYDDTELDRKEKWERNKQKHFPTLNVEFKDTLYLKNIKESEKPNHCIICNSTTHFQHILTNNFVCSDECKYKDKENYNG